MFQGKSWVSSVVLSYMLYINKAVSNPVVTDSSLTEGSSQHLAKAYIEKGDFCTVLSKKTNQEAMFATLELLNSKATEKDKIITQVSFIHSSTLHMEQTITI